MYPSTVTKASRLLAILLQTLRVFESAALRIRPARAEENLSEPATPLCTLGTYCPCPTVFWGMGDAIGSATLVKRHHRFNLPRLALYV
jgi:hypothetical protein